MSTQKNDRSVSSTQNSGKKLYKTPELKNFGQISELTAAGSGFRDERRPGMGSSMRKA